MNTRFMMSVAAMALIAGTGFANAQGTGMSREAPAAEHAAPSSAAPMNRNDASDSAAPTAKGPSDEKMQPPGGQKQRAQQDMKAGPKSAQDNGMKQDNAKGAPSKMSSENDKANGGKEMNADSKNADSKNPDSRNAESKSATETRSQTTGQAGAGAKLSSDQRTKITTVIKGQHIQPVTNVNFSISVGTRVPRDVSFHPLPAEIVTIYPDWRGYEFILVNDQIIVVNPQTFEIVAVIDA
jgi:Protein of unknown function (DUF1236)